MLEKYLRYERYILHILFVFQLNCHQLRAKPLMCRKHVGAHVSAAGGVHHAVHNAVAIGANAFALFTRNQRRWISKPLDPSVIAAFKAACLEHGFNARHILPHASYLINLGHPEQDGREKSYAGFLDEMQRCEQLGLTQLNVHPGSHLRQISEAMCISYIADSINRVLEHTQGVSVVLENTAGQGSNIGHRFEQLAAIMARVEDASRVGVCIDTCHAFAAGYDLSSAADTQCMLNTLDDTVGLHTLRGMHLNDSKTPCGSRVDRHARLGEGMIGLPCFTVLMREAQLSDVPFILETTDPTRWADEINWLRAQALC